MHDQLFRGVKPGRPTDTPAEAIREAFGEGQRVGSTLALHRLRQQARACRTLEEVLGLLDLQVAGVPVRIRTRREGVARAA